MLWQKRKKNGLSWSIWYFNPECQPIFHSLDQCFARARVTEFQHVICPEWRCPLWVMPYKFWLCTWSRACYCPIRPLFIQLFSIPLTTPCCSPTAIAAASADPATGQQELQQLDRREMGDKCSTGQLVLITRIQSVLDFQSKASICSFSILDISGNASSCVIPREVIEVQFQREESANVWREHEMGERF